MAGNGAGWGWLRLQQQGMVNWLELAKYHEKETGQHKAMSIFSHVRKPWERLSSAIKTVYFKYVKI